MADELRVGGAEDLAGKRVPLEFLHPRPIHVDLSEDAETLIGPGFGGALSGLVDSQIDRLPEQAACHSDVAGWGAMRD